MKVVDPLAVLTVHTQVSRIQPLLIRVRRIVHARRLYSRYVLANKAGPCRQVGTHEGGPRSNLKHGGRSPP